MNADREIDLDPAAFLNDLRWAIALAALYWAQSLLSRSTVIDPAASRETNVGYNIRELTILALATLTAGVVVMVRQAWDLPASGWAMLGPLLAFRFLYDVATGLELARRRLDHPSGATHSAQSATIPGSVVGSNSKPNSTE